jgi:hypothetical protein
MVEAVSVDDFGSELGNRQIVLGLLRLIERDSTVTQRKAGQQPRHRARRGQRLSAALCS